MRHCRSTDSVEGWRCAGAVRRRDGGPARRSGQPPGGFARVPVCTHPDGAFEMRIRCLPQCSPASALPIPNHFVACVHSCARISRDSFKVLVDEKDKPAKK